MSEATSGGAPAPPAASAGANALRQRYERALAARQYQADPAQLAAVLALEELRTRLVAAGPAARLHLPRWLAHLTGRQGRVAVKGLYLWGGVGRGKTWLMDLFFASLPFRQARRQHFHRFMQDVHLRLSRLQHQLNPLEQVARDIARDTRVLCFDELCVTDIADAMILAGLFAGLFRCGVTLVATSNLPPQELYQDGLQRQRFLPAIALLEESLDVLRIGGTTDYRLRHLIQADIYLPAADVRTMERLRSLFDKLSDHPVPANDSIEIAGRQIAVVQVSTAVVWFTFAALCSSVRSQDDYIEIAREYSSVIVSDVPVLDASHEDEARRFIALVDELYDHNVNLILSAAAPPAMLYRGERLGALFARTASRLVEMQSEAYLAREHRP